MKHDLDQLEDAKLKSASAKLENRKQRTDAELDEENLEDYGDIRIADEVISIVASLAAQEVPGVLGMSGGLTDGINRFLGKENASKGVRLKFEGKTVNANVYINVEYGSCIPEIALEVQEIEAMTGYEVQFVDVNVEGVAKRQATELEKEATSDEAMAEILRAQAQRAEATEVNSFEQQLAGLRNQQEESFDTNVKAIKKKHELAAEKAQGQSSFELPPEEEMDARQKRFFEED